MNFATSYVSSQKIGQEKPDLNYFINLRNLKHKDFKQKIVSITYDTNTDYYFIYNDEYKAFKKWILSVYENKSFNYVNKSEFMKKLTIKKNLK